MNDYAGAAFF